MPSTFSFAPIASVALTVIAYISDPSVLEKILGHLGLPTTSPPLSPVRRPEQVELFDGDHQPHAGPRSCRRRSLPQRGIRGPPHEGLDESSAPEETTEVNDGTVDLEMDWGA